MSGVEVTCCPLVLQSPTVGSSIHLFIHSVSHALGLQALASVLGRGMRKLGAQQAAGCEGTRQHRGESLRAWEGGSGNEGTAPRGC